MILFNQFHVFGYIFLLIFSQFNLLIFRQPLLNIEGLLHSIIYKLLKMNIDLKKVIEKNQQKLEQHN